MVTATPTKKYFSGLWPIQGNHTGMSILAPKSKGREISAKEEMTHNSPQRPNTFEEENWKEKRVTDPNHG